MASRASPGTSALPVAPELSRQLFSHADFDLDTFLLERRHVALDELRSDLRRFLADLRTELVGTINDDVDDYIGLAIGLRMVDKRLERVRQPIEGVREDILSIRQQLQAIRSTIQDKLAERADVRHQKATLRLMLSINESVLKVEALLLIPPPDGLATPTPSAPSMGSGRTGEDRTLLSGTKRIERVASEYIQMLYLVGKGLSLPFVQSLQPRIDKAQTTLQRDLAALLSSTLQRPAKAEARQSLLECFRTYQVIARVPDAEAVFRREIVKPWANAHITRDALTGPLSASVVSQTPLLARDEGKAAARTFEPVPNRAGSAPLVDLYNKILTFIAKDCALVLDVTENKLGGQASEGPERDPRGPYDLLANVIFDEIVNRLVSELGHIIFAAGRPDSFHSHFLTSVEYIKRIESFCPTARHLAALHASSAWSLWQKRWQLPVYFQLRFKEIAGTLESALAAQETLTARAAQSTGFLLPGTAAVYSAIRTCWASDVHLEDLSSRFWRLTLQLLARYKIWLDDILPRHQTSLTNGHTPQPSTDSRFLGSPAAGVSRPGTPSTEPNDDAVLRQLSVIVVDTTRLCDRVHQLFDSTIAAALVDDASPRTALQASTDSLRAVLPPLLVQIAAILVRQAADPLRAGLRSVTSEVRAGTSAPTEPSHFIGRVLKPVRSFLDGPGKDIAAESRASIVSDVLDEVATRYASQLDQMRATQDSLRRLKKGRVGFSLFSRSTATADDNVGTKDEDAFVKQQVRLDVEAFTAEAKRLGADVGSGNGFGALDTALAAELAA